MIPRAVIFAVALAVPPLPTFAADAADAAKTPATVANTARRSDGPQVSALDPRQLQEAAPSSDQSIRIDVSTVKKKSKKARMANAFWYVVAEKVAAQH